METSEIAIVKVLREQKLHFVRMKDLFNEEKCKY